MSKTKTTDHIKDLELLDSVLTNARAKVRYEIADIREKQRARQGKSRGVSDHAVVRYLERTGKVDIAAIREEINRMVENAKSFKHTDGMWHSESGLVFIVEQSTVVTVLSAEQSEHYIGRTLLSGEVAERLEASSKRVAKNITPVHCKICNKAMPSPGAVYRHVLQEHPEALGTVLGAADDRS